MAITYEWRGEFTNDEVNRFDFEEHLLGFYLDACGFRPASAGLLALTRTGS